MTNPLSLTGKTIAVTGASSGIGRATAVLAGKLGGRVILVARDQKRLEQTMSQLEGTGHRLECLDLSKGDTLPAWLKSVSADTGPISGIAHCAGAQILRPLQVQSATQIEDLLRINVVSAILLARAFRQKGVHECPGSIVLLSSVMGTVGEAGRSAYCASKGALHALTKSLALELAKDDIRVNCVAPGVVDTEMGEESAETLGSERTRSIIDRHPIGLGMPEDVAYAIVYLLAGTGRWITGAVNTVDGGYTAR